MPRLTIVTHRRLDAERSGSKTYLQRMIALAEEAGFEVGVACAPRATFSNRPWAAIAPAFAEGRTIDWPDTVRAGGLYWSLSPTVWSRFVWRVVQETMRRLKIGPKAWRKPWSNLGLVPPTRELEVLARAVDSRRPSVVLVEYSSLAPLFPLLSDSSGRAVLMHDSFAARAELYEALGADQDYDTPPSWRDEADRLGSANLVFHASLGELKRFEALAPRASHVWLRPTAPVRAEALKPLETPRLVYIGANQSGSRDAIEHFLGDVWPLVRAQAAEANLDIIGPVGASLPDALISEGVHVLGMVDDLADYAGPDRIGLAPTRLASGISIKIGEYLGLGLPVVAYRMGVEGYGDTLEGLVSVADTPEAFAREILSLLSDAELRAARAHGGLKAAEALLRNDDARAALAALKA